MMLLYIILPYIPKLAIIVLASVFYIRSRWLLYEQTSHLELQYDPNLKLSAVVDSITMLMKLLMKLKMQKIR